MQPAKGDTMHSKLRHPKLPGGSKFSIVLWFDRENFWLLGIGEYCLVIFCGWVQRESIATRMGKVPLDFLLKVPDFGGFKGN